MVVQLTWQKTSFNKERREKSKEVFKKEKCNILYFHVTRESRNIFPWRLVKKNEKDIRSDLRTAKVSQTRILTEKDLILACTGQFKEDGINMTMCPRNMACFGDRVENVTCAHPVHGNRKGKPERGATLGMSKEIMSKWNTFVPVGAGKAGIYTCLPYFKISWCPLGLVETWSRDRSEEGVGVEVNRKARLLFQWSMVLNKINLHA